MFFLVFLFFSLLLFSVCIFSWFNVPDLDTLTIGADSASEVLPSHGQVSLQVEVIKSNGVSSVFSISVPRGSSLFEALNLLQDKQTGFTWDALFEIYFQNIISKNLFAFYCINYNNFLWVLFQINAFALCITALAQRTACGDPSSVWSMKNKHVKLIVDTGRSPQMAPLWHRVRNKYVHFKQN